MTRATSKLKIAISQFPVDVDMASNFGYICRHIEKAAEKHADVVHFPELALSGYETDIKKIDWKLLDNSLGKLQVLAREKRVFIVIGAHVKNPKSKKPYNSTLLISDKGEIVGQYIKTKLYKDETKRFLAKSNFFIHEIKGVKCGFLICYDSCFPDLFAKYRKAGVKVMFLSLYNAKSTKPKNSMDDLMRSQVITRAADNLMYISASNSSSYYSRMPSSYISPDGKIISAKRHVPGIIIGEYPTIDLGWTYDNRM